MSCERNIFDLFGEVPSTSEQTVTVPLKRTSLITKSLPSETNTSISKRYGVRKNGRSIEMSRWSAVRNLQRLRQLNQVIGVRRGQFVANENPSVSPPNELSTTQDWTHWISPEMSSASTFSDPADQYHSRHHSQCKIIVEAITRAVIKGEQPQWTSGTGPATDQQRIAKLSSMRSRRSTNPGALQNRIALQKVDTLRFSHEKDASESTTKPTSPVSAFISSEVDSLLSLSQNHASGQSESRYKREDERQRGMRAALSASSVEKVLAGNDATLAVSAVVSESELLSRKWKKTVEASDEVPVDQNSGLKNSKAVFVSPRKSSFKGLSPIGNATASSLEDFDRIEVDIETEQSLKFDGALVVTTRPTAEECLALKRLLTLCRDALSIKTIDLDDPRWPEIIEAGAVLTIKNQERRLEWLKRETEHEMVKQRNLFEALIRLQKRRAAICQKRPLHQPSSHKQSQTKTVCRLVSKCDLDVPPSGKSIRISQENIGRMQTSTAAAVPGCLTTLNVNSSKETPASIARTFGGASSSCILIRTRNGWRKLVKVQPPTHLNSATISKSY